MISKQDGALLLRIARQAVESVFLNAPYNLDPETKKRFSEHSGVFVTIYKNNELRGCIGFVEPVYSVWEAVIGAARAAAFKDPRFVPVTKDELSQLKFEVSVLSVPEEMVVNNPLDYKKQIRIGKDGLMVSFGMNSGLLLPKVAVEQKWEAQEFLEHTCEKAGLSPDAWKERACHVYKFQAQVFSQ